MLIGVSWIVDTTFSAVTTTSARPSLSSMAAAAAARSVANRKASESAQAPTNPGFDRMESDIWFCFIVIAATAHQAASHVPTCEIRKTPTRLTGAQHQRLSHLARQRVRLHENQMNKHISEREFDAFGRGTRARLRPLLDAASRQLHHEGAALRGHLRKIGHQFI